MADLHVGNTNRVLTESELGEVLGLSKWTVRGMRLKEGMVHFTVGHRIFYRLESVLAWIDDKERGQQKPVDEYGTLREIK